MTETISTLIETKRLEYVNLMSQMFDMLADPSATTQDKKNDILKRFSEIDEQLALLGIYFAYSRKTGLVTVRALP